MNAAISIKSLSKTYAAKPPKEALKSVDLDIPKGSIFGLLGPNGAGKSTLINILAGLVNKTSGSVHIWGNDMDQDARSCASAIGIVPQELTYDAFFSPRGSMELQAGLYGVPKSERRTEEILANVGLLDKADAYVRSLSGGMKRRLMVAKAMVHTPPILVLDEPTAGVDVELRRQLWEQVRRMNKEQGLTVVLTTHYLEEAEELCDEIAIINHGKIVAQDTTVGLVDILDSKTLTVTLPQAIDAVPDGLKNWDPSLDGTILSFTYKPSQSPVNEILRAIRHAELDIVDVTTTETDLEDTFLKLTAA